MGNIGLYIGLYRDIGKEKGNYCLGFRLSVGLLAVGKPNCDRFRV